MQEIEKLLRKRLLKVFDFSAIEEENSRVMIEEFFSKTQNLYHILAQQVSGARKPEIEICCTHPLFFDAFISNLNRENHFFVGLSYGVLANLFSCFMGLLSHPDVLPHIGDRYNTQCGFTIIEDGLIDFTYENEIVKNRTALSEGIPLWNYPKDEERILYALLLTDIAYQFVIYHEWGHLVGGHLAYMKQIFGLDELSETDQPGSSDIIKQETIQGEPIRKVMEFDADLTATVMVSSLAHHLPKFKRTFFQAYPENFLAKVDIRDAIFFSIMSLFHLFQEVRMKRGIRDHQLYPSLYYRFSTLIYGVNIHTEENPSSAWANYNYQGIRDFSEMSAVLGFDFQFNEIYDAEKIKNDMIALADMREELKEKLSQFRFGD